MISGILKRKHEEGPSSHLSTAASDDEVSCSDSGNSSDSLNPPVPSGLLHSSLQPKSKRFRGRNVHFENVTVYYFGRRQGFTSVPTQGGSTLGMSPRHSCVRSFTLREFALEQKRSHRNMLRHHLKEEKLNAIRLKLTKNGTESSAEADTLSLDDISVDELEVDNTEVDEYFFLQPLTTRRRRALLRASGVRRIAVEEKHELRTLRVSREECGCCCRGACEPETCACSLAGIKCQVDRMSFPCGCTKDGCSNSAGRLEFNPVRVRTHFLHTIMKLELEKSREEPLLHLQHPPPPPPPPLSEHQQLVTNGNGFHSDPSSLVQTQQQPNLQFPLMMHLQSDAADPCLEEEEERDEEEEDDDDDDDDEEEEDEAYEEDEDGSSVCSGLSDCSTHSLDTNDPEDAEDSEEEEDDEGEEEDEEWDCPLQSTNAPPYPVPLPSILSYSNSTLASPSFHYRENQGQSLPTVDTALNSDMSSTQHQAPPCCLPPQLLLNSQSLPPRAQMREEEAAPSGGHSALLPNNPDWCDSQTDNVAK
uniref:Cysteine/serine-rich nuclear protein N-terminal domain-containing protein n=1 Tax=Knipowitschia caucasica TaxID=637954 RepID=A0AAV2LDP9_KNICA